MRSSLFKTLLFSACSLTHVLASTRIELVVEPQSAVSKNNRAAHFNWVFESESGRQVQKGQFACGSYWVAPARGETGVRLLSLNGSGIEGHRDLLALDADPAPHAHGLLHQGAKTYGSNHPDEDDRPKLPLVYTPPANSCISLVAAMQRNESETSKGGTKAIEGGVIDAYCIVTVLAEAPPHGGSDMIRPNIVGDTKELLTWNDFDLSRLPRHAFITAGLDSAAKWNHATEIFSMRTWNGESFNSYSEGGRAFRPHLLYHNYAAGRAASINNAMLGLLGNQSLENKKPLLAAILAEGLDTWHLVCGREDFPGGWSSGAGQWGGQFMPAVFAAALLKDDVKAGRLMRTAALNIGEDSARRGPQEMRQIMRGNNGVLLWGDGHNPVAGATQAIPGDTRRYWNDLKWGSCYIGAIGDCNSNVGKKTTADPHGFIDGPPARPGTSYMAIATGNARSFAAIMILFPGVREIVNSDNVIEYVDRVHRVGVWTEGDPLAAVPLIDQKGECNIWSGGGAGCSEYRLTWGPSLNDARYGIENGIGRFPDQHGKKIKYAYTSSNAESNWAQIIEMYDGKRYEDWLVKLDTAVAPEILAAPKNGQIEVHMRSGTTDAQIYYTLDGGEPGLASHKYSSPFILPQPAEIRAVAVKPEMKTSAVTISRPPAPFPK